MTDVQRLEQWGGVDTLVRACVTRFASDWVIGFLFEGKDLERIIRHEAEHAKGHLGAGVPYTGQPLARVHRPLRINAGHFRRRLALVRTVLGEQGVDPDIIERWVAADARLQAAIVDGTDCAPPDSQG
jgi:truncated hemoglobin YjbI